MNQLYDTPVVLVDETIVRQNITQMVTSLRRCAIDHRPHIKAHKSTLIAAMQVELGARGITCAKISEAEVMADAGFRDILIANEIVGEIKLARLVALCRRADIKICVDSLVGAFAASNAALAAGIRIRVLIEVNIGANRCGLRPDAVVDFAKAIRDFQGIEIVGLLTYNGKIYGKTIGADMIREAGQEARILTDLKTRLEAEQIPIQLLSAGSSLSSKYPDALLGITESRAGNYIFNDCTGLFSGLYTLDECALRIVSTIISIPEPGRVIIDAGTKTLSSDVCFYHNGFGYVVEYPEMEIYSLNEEHGYIHYPDTDKLQIGQQITIIPNHACVIPNLTDTLVGIRSDGSSFLIPVEARGKNK